MRSIWIRTSAIASAVMASFALAAPAVEDERMEKLSDALIAIERGLDAERTKALTPQADQIRRLAAVVAAVEHADSEHGQLANRLFAHAEVLHVDLEAGRLAEARIGFAELRETCVRCHAKFRQSPEGHRLFPATANTLHGEVKVLALDGTPKEESANVVVFLEGIDAPIAARQPRTNPVMYQRGKIFRPRVLPVVLGSEADFPNDDDVFHNVFSLSRTKPFDFGVYGKKESKSLAFDKPGLVKIYCNIHPEMTASVLVLNNHHFDVTDEAGRFVIPDVPDGRFMLRTWHEFGGGEEQEVVLEGGVLRRVELSLRETKRAGQHLNKFGKPYRRKY